MASWTLSQQEREETIELLRNLIAQRTVNPPGEEEKAAQVLEEFLRAHGVSAERYDVEPGRPNLLCRVEGRRVGRSMLLTSHMDVVAPGRLDLWTHDPFEPYIVGGKLYGRGSCDAKASLAAMAAAVVHLAMDRRFDGQVLFGAAMGEEINGIGSQRMAEACQMGDAVWGLDRSAAVHRVTSHNQICLRRSEVPAAVGSKWLGGKRNGWNQESRPGRDANLSGNEVYGMGKKVRIRRNLAMARNGWRMAGH